MRATRIATIVVAIALVLVTQRATGQRATGKGPTGAPAQSSVEIAAIDLPEVVRHAIVATYKGYQFVETRRIDRGKTSRPQFEIHLERPADRVVVVFSETGEVVSKKLVARPGPPVPSSNVVGTWRGTSTCPAKYGSCDVDSVVYRIRAVAADSDAFDIATVRSPTSGTPVNGGLACTLDRRRIVLVCIAKPGYWEFVVHGDSLSGTLTLGGGLTARNVTAHRQ